jgi:hypothetical protein
MQDHPKGAGEAPSTTTWDEDEREQAAVLRQVLDHHSDALTQDELVREMTGGGSRKFSEIDAVQRAIRELAGAGLLHRPGEDEMVRPTRAAVRYSELTEGAI